MNKRGFTLIETLIGLALLTLVFATVTVLITRSAQAGRQSSVQAAANTSVTKLGEQLGRDLSSGSVVLTAASQRRLDLLRLGKRTPLTLAEGASRKNTSRLTVKGNPLASLSGKPVVVVSSTGDYLLTRVSQVTPAADNSEVVFSCLVSLPGNLSVYPFTALSLEETLSGLRRTEEGAAQIVGSNVQKVRFEPVYGTVTGVFSPTPMNPVSHHAGERLSAVNYALTSGGEHPITAAGTARLNLVGFREWGCNENPDAPANNLGKLQVNVLYKGGTTGPAGVTPGVGVSGPGTSSNINTWTRQTFENLDAGTYSVSAPSLTQGELIYDATVTGSPATVGNGKQGTVNVNYLVRKGKITLDISGLPTPPPASGAVRFSGPESLSVPAQNGTPTVELTPGDYAVSADPIGEYEPEISNPSPHISSTTNDTITVTYGIPKGTVNLEITGLPTPPPATGYVQVTGPESKTIAAQSGTTTLTLKKGDYTVTADQVGEYEPSISSSTVTVGKNTSTTVTVNYAIPSGPLALSVQGLPAGNSAALSVSGPVSQTVTVESGTTQTVNLQQGNYTVTAPEVTVGGTKYLPSPASATVSLGKGGAGHTVTYTAANPLPDTTTPPAPLPKTTTPPDPTKVVFRVTIGYDDQNPTTVTLVNADTGQQYQAQAQSFSGYAAGSWGYTDAEGEKHSTSWSAKPPASSIAEFSVDPGTYYIAGFGNQGNGYSIVSVGFQFDHIDGISIPADKQQKAIGPTAKIVDENNLAAFKNMLYNYKTMYVNTRFDIKPGIYNLVTGLNPNSGAGGSFMTTGQWTNVECGFAEVLVTPIGCVERDGY